MNVSPSREILFQSVDRLLFGDANNSLYEILPNVSLRTFYDPLSTGPVSGEFCGKKAGHSSARRIVLR